MAFVAFNFLVNFSLKTFEQCSKNKFSHSAIRPFGHSAIRPFGHSALTISLFVLSALSMIGQTTPTALRSDNTFIQGITEKVDPAGWLFFKPTADLLPAELFTVHASSMGLGQNDEMRLEKNETDELGFTHNRYQQFYKNVEVEAAEYTEHIRNCMVEMAHGKLVEGLNTSTNPSLTEAQALQAALNFLGASQYIWQDTQVVNFYRQEEGDISITLYPKGQLLFSQGASGSMSSSNYKLTWRFVIHATDPSFVKTVDVDANNGSIISTKDDRQENGPAPLLHGYGTRTIDTQWRGGFHQNFRLLGNDDGHFVHTRKGAITPITTDPLSVFANASEFKDADDVWDSSDEIGTTTHWGACKAWDYFRSVWGRNGIAGNGKIQRILATTSSSGFAAFFDPTSDIIQVENFLGTHMSAVDNIGHEYTHGVTHYASGLGDNRESGALNESFSDIFGNLVERYTFPSNSNWLIAEDVAPTGKTALRSLENPGDPNVFAPGPDTYKGNLWIDATTNTCQTPSLGNDFCGKHTNCGVQNRWFFLLANGGSQNGVSVTGIGIDNAAKVTQRNLFNYIQTGSKYADSRVGAISAARDLFGKCSFEEAQTTNAWAAVGVGDIFVPCTDVSIQGPTFVCTNLNEFPLVYTATQSVSGNLTWSYPTGWNVSISGNGSKLTVNSIFPTPANNSTATITVSSTNGATSSITIHFKNSCHSVGGCGGEDRAREPVEEQDYKAADFQIYPSPAFDYIYLKGTNDLEKAQTVEVINVLGQVIKSQPVSKDGITAISIEDLQSGTYFLRVSGTSIPRVISFIKS